MSSEAPAPAPPAGRPSARPLPMAGPAHPSFPLVASHFGLAFGWALLGGAGLVWIAPSLTAGQFLDPRVLAVTHLVTLGFLATVITGVLYQIFPAMLGIGERSRRVAGQSLVLHATGTGLLVTGLLAGNRWLQSAGWVVLFLAVFGTAWNLLPQRRRAPRNRQLGIYISYAHMGFGLAMGVAGVRIGDALGWWTTPRLGLLAAHFHLAIAGFVGMTAFGLGSRMIPMFLGSQRPIPAWCDRWLPRALATGTVVYAAGAILAAPPLQWTGIALMTASVALFLGLGFRWFLHRAGRGLDPAIAFIALALSSLTVALPLGLTVQLTGLTRPGVLVAYALLLLLGWSSCLVLGVSYRVLPTLTWHHRFAARVGRPGTPTLPQMVLPALGLGAAVSAFLGLLGLVAGLLLGAPPAGRAGAVLFTLALLATVLHHLRMLLVGRTPPAARGGSA